jgi:PEP-CTERM motif
MLNGRPEAFSVLSGRRDPMRRFLSTCVVFFSLLVLPAGAVADIYITFDEGGSAVVDFVSTVPLTSAYSSSGVTFSGPSAGQGGAILNQSGNFGVNAYSGTNFLAFNGTTYATGPETIVFTDLWKTVSIYAAGGNSINTFLMQAFDSIDSLVGTASVITQGWSLLAVSSEIEDIRKVVLTQTAGDGTFVFDDLRATDSSAPVPEPASLILLLAGIAGLAGLRSGRRS